MRGCVKRVPCRAMSIDEPTPSGPSSSFYFSQRLKLHYLDWGNPDKPPLLLIHGGRDHARSWDWVARELRGDFHVIAPDLRGHGDSSWALGGNYALTDFVVSGNRDVFNHTLFRNVVSFPRASYAWLQPDGSYEPVRYWDLPGPSARHPGVLGRYRGGGGP